MHAREAVGEHQRIDEAGAGAGQVDRTGAVQSQPMCDQRRAGRQEVIGCRGGEQQQADVAPVDARICQRHVAGMRGKTRQRVFVRCPEARPNPGAPLNPVMQ